MVNALEQEIINTREYLHTKRTAQASADERQQRKQTIILAQQHDLYAYKFQLATEIFDWNKDFVNKPAFREIADLQRLAGYGGLDRSSVRIYTTAAWGHNNEYKTDFGCWSRIQLHPAGSMLYNSGYKMAQHPPLSIPSAKTIAGAFHSEYIAGLHQYIQSGEVYTQLAKDVKALRRY
jgi:hypothetical protein